MIIIQVQVQLDTEAPRIVSLTARVRSQNPLLSLLSQPLGRMRDEEESTNRWVWHISHAI